MRANGVSTHDLLDGAPLRTLAKPSTRRRTSTSSWRRATSLRRRSSSRQPGRRRAVPRGRARRSRRRLLVRPPRLPAVVRPADRQRACRREPRDRAGAGGVLRARGPLAASRDDQPREGAAESRARRRRDPADDGRRAHAPLRRGRGRAPPAFRIARVHDDDPPLGAPGGGAEPRCSLRSPTTAARPAPRPTGRWRWSLSSVPKERRGLGRGLEVLLGEAGQPELVHLPVETIHPNPRQPRRRFEPEAAAGLASSIRLQGVLQPIVVAAAGGWRLRAHRRRAALACRAAAGDRDAAGARPGRRGSRLAPPRARRERRPRAALPGRGSAGLRVARRRVRALAR